MNKLKSTHGFRVGDVVKEKRDGEIYVVSSTKSWIHKPFTHKEGKMKGKRDAWISVVKEIGVISTLGHASEYKLVMRREQFGKRWWSIFPKGEK